MWKRFHTSDICHQATSFNSLFNSQHNPSIAQPELPGRQDPSTTTVLRSVVNPAQSQQLHSLSSTPPKNRLMRSCLRETNRPPNKPGPRMVRNFDILKPPDSSTRIRTSSEKPVIRERKKRAWDFRLSDPGSLSRLESLSHQLGHRYMDCRPIQESAFRQNPGQIWRWDKTLAEV